MSAETEALARLVAHPSILVLDIPVCWQCSHPEEDHLSEEQGCTHPECACAQVPEQ